MSRQLIDTVQRILENSFLQVDKGKYKKALENLEKAEKLLEKANIPEFSCQALMLKGKALLASGISEEALAEFQRALKLAVSYLLEDPANVNYQHLIYNDIGFIVKTLREMNSPSKTKESLYRNEKYFEEIIAAYEGLLTEERGRPVKPREPGEHEEPDNFEYIMNYLKTLENIRAYFLEAKQFEKDAYFTGRIVQNYGRALKIQSDNGELFDSLDKSIRKFTRHCLIFRKPGEAKGILVQAEDIYREILGNEPGNRLAFDSLISLYEESGELYAGMGDTEKAEETFLRALDLLEDKLLKEPGSISNIKKQSEILRDLSRSLFEEESEKAGQYAERALEILKELAGKNPEDLDYQYELSDGFYELGELFGDMYDIEHAKESYMKEIEIYRSIYEKDPEDPESLENIAEAFDQIGHLYAGEGEIETAKHYYEQGIETYGKLLESCPGNFDYEIDIANSLNYIGELYKYPEPENARSYFEKALAINEKAVTQSPESTRYKEDLIYTLKNLASLNAGQNQYENAVQLHERINEIYREIVAENPGKYEYEKALGVSYSELGLILEKAEKPELAKQQYSKAIEVFRDILQNEEKEPLIKQMLAAELRMQAALFTHSKKHSIAREYLELIRNYYQNLYENDPENPVNWKGVYEVWLLDGNLQESMKNYRTAAEKYELALQIIQKHLESDPENPEYQEKAGFAYTQLGSVYCLVYEYEKSKEALEKALSINEKLLEKDPEDPLYIRDTASTFEEYAKLLRKLDRNEEAEEYSKRAKTQNEKMGRKGLDEKIPEEEP